MLGCQRDDSAVMEELQKMNATLIEIKANTKGGGAGRAGAAKRPQRPQRARPKPNLTYSVPIAGAPFKGASAAKVTIVEAFEFA